MFSLLAIYIFEACLFRYIALTLSIYKNIYFSDKFNFVQINLFVQDVSYFIFISLHRKFSKQFILSYRSNRQPQTPLLYARPPNFQIFYLIPFTHSILKIYSLLINYSFFHIPIYLHKM